MGRIWRGAVLMAVMAIAGCDRKGADSGSLDVAAVAPPADTSIDLSDEAAEAADVYAAPFEFDLAAIRTKDALAAAADAAFAEADADGDGVLSQTEFYALAALLAPPIPPDGAVETMTDVFSETGGSAEVVTETLLEEPIFDATALDESYAAIAGEDGVLSPDDLRLAFGARFDAADANADGELDDLESSALVADRLF